MSNILKAPGIVLNSIDYKANIKLVTIYLFGYGKILLKIRTSSKNFKNNAASSIMVFCDYVINIQKKELISYDIKDTFINEKDSFKKYLSKMAILEILLKFCKDGVKKDDFAIIALKTLIQIHTSKDTEEKYLAYCLLSMLKEEGYQSNFKKNLETTKEFINGARFTYNEQGLDDIISFQNEDLILSKRALLQLEFLSVNDIVSLEKIESAKVEKSVLKWLIKFFLYKTDLKINSLNSYNECLKF